MDSETTRLLVSVLGTLGGALVGWLSAYSVARANSRAQRQLGNDNARREYRLRQVQPLLERAGRRVSRFQDFMLAGFQPGAQPLREAWERVLAEGLLAEMAYASIPSAAFQEALHQILEADSALRRVAVAMISSYDPRGATPEQTAQFRAQLVEASGPFVSALVALNQAAESYAFGDDPHVVPGSSIRVRSLLDRLLSPRH